MSREQILKLPSKKRRELLAKAATEYNESLALAETYLRNRGIPIEAADAWKLGVVLDPLPGHEQYKGRLSIPYLTPAGVVDMKFRCIADHRCSDVDCTKYLGEMGHQSRLFGALSLQMDSTIMCICEGELDTLCAVQLAGLPAVGINGVNKWKSHYKYLFEGYREVVVFVDGDPRTSPDKPSPGERFGEFVVSKLYNARAVPMPQGEDVNSFLQRHGARALRTRAGLDMDGNA